MTAPAGDPVGAAAGAAPGPDTAADGGRRLVDEALRLVEALRDSGLGAGAPYGGPADAGDDGDTAAGPQVHLGPECRICPFCRAVATVRALRPEAVEQLALAAAELARAWREVVATPPPPAPGPARRDEPPVERIDVTD